MSADVEAYTDETAIAAAEAHGHELINDSTGFGFTSRLSCKHCWRAVIKNGSTGHIYGSALTERCVEGRPNVSH